MKIYKVKYMDKTDERSVVKTEHYTDKTNADSAARAYTNYGRPAAHVSEIETED